MSIRVKFNDVEEFLEEMGAHPKGAFEDGLVRVTQRTAQGGSLPLRHVSVVASAVIHGRLFVLERYVGQLFGIGSEGDARTRKDAEAIVDRLCAGCAALGLATRPGVFEGPRDA